MPTNPSKCWPGLAQSRYAPRPPSTFSCSLCFEDKEEEDALCIVPEEQVCEECIADFIIPQFHEALKYEHKYPPRWGQTDINIGLFAAQLGQDFLTRYERREAEYKIPVHQRLYCKHKVLAAMTPEIGSRADPSQLLALWPHEAEAAALQGLEVQECSVLAQDRSYGGPPIVQCRGCNGTLCGKCGTPYHIFDPNHLCIPLTKLTVDHVAKEGELTRGKDYQVCPGCAYPVDLKEGCNHLICPRCRRGFCFICGEEASHNSGHWAKGGRCPRFHQPDARNAIFDVDQPVSHQLRDVQRENERHERLMRALVAGLLIQFENGSDLNIDRAMAHAVVVVGPALNAQRFLRDATARVQMISRVRAELDELSRRPMFSAFCDETKLREMYIKSLRNYLVWSESDEAVPRFRPPRLNNTLRAFVLRHHEILQVWSMVPAHTQSGHLGTLRRQLDSYRASIPGWVNEAPHV